MSDAYLILAKEETKEATLIFPQFDRLKNPSPSQIQVKVGGGGVTI